MTRIKIHISNVKLPFYPPCEVKCRLQNRVSTRLCPHQCAPNFFRVLGSIDALDRHLGLGLTWYDVAHLYESHIETRAGFYLKSRSSVVKLISYLPKFNKGMKDDYLILSGPWSDDLPCPTKLGKLGGAT